MFVFKKKKEEDHAYDLTYDNLAVPEIHTHKIRGSEEENDTDSGITYDSVAIPEIHIRKK